MKWPRDNPDALIAFYGAPGDTSQHIRVIPPFRMTYAGNAVPYLMFHKLAAPALERVLAKVWEFYGRDQAKVDALGISKTAGTYNLRKISGSDRWSNHSWAIAIDINAEENGFFTAGNIPIPMIAAFKAEGARWGGDYKGRKDPMHFEFVESGETARTFEEWLQVYGVGPNVMLASTPPTKNTYDEALRRLLQDEGGYSNDPADAGGPTNFGITLADYRQYIDPAGTAADVRDMKVEQAKVIYKARYWDAMNCDALPAGVDYATFDYGVNSGINRAPQVLQRIVGVEDVDGEIGPITLTAVRARNPKELINAICDERMIFLRGRSNWGRFGVGWTGRVSRVRAASLAMADATPSSVPVILPPLQPKPGQTMPTDGPVPYNAALDDCVIELAKVQRPVLEKFIKGSQAALTPEQLKAAVIVALGGTVPPSMVLLPGPTSQPTPTPVVVPVGAVPATSDTVATAGGFMGLLLAAAGQMFGFMPTVGDAATTVGPAVTAASLLSVAGGALGAFSPTLGLIMKIVGPLISRAVSK